MLLLIFIATFSDKTSIWTIMPIVKGKCQRLAGMTNDFLGYACMLEVMPNQINNHKNLKMSAYNILESAKHRQEIRIYVILICVYCCSIDNLLAFALKVYLHYLIVRKGNSATQCSNSNSLYISHDILSFHVLKESI